MTIQNVRIREEAKEVLLKGLKEHPNPEVGRFQEVVRDGYVSVDEVEKIWLFRAPAIRFQNAFQRSFGVEVERLESGLVPSWIDAFLKKEKLRIDFVPRVASLPAKPSLTCQPPVPFSEELKKVEPSGIVAYGNYFLVVNDKSNDIFVFDEQGSPVRTISGKVFGPLKKFEGIATDQGKIYVIGDYKNESKSGEVEDHSTGFEFSFPRGADVSQWEVHQTSKLTLKIPEPYGWNQDPSKNKIKIEGLAVRDGIFYVGLRESPTLTEGEGGGIILSGKVSVYFDSAAQPHLNEEVVSLSPYFSFPAGTYVSEPLRPLRISDLSVNRSGDLLILMSSQSSSKWPKFNQTREERFAGNQLFYWNVGS